MAGRLTRPAATPEEPGGARKTALEIAAGILVTDASGPEPVVAGHGEVEHVRFEDVEASALESLMANPVLHYGTPGQRAKAAYELRKAGGKTPAEAAPAVTGAATPVEAPEEGESNLSKLAARIAGDPETEGKLRSALNEIDQAAIDAAAIENLYGSEGEDYGEGWEWPEPEPAVEGGEQ